jgi:ATP-dependent DNA ligase
MSYRERKDIMLAHPMTEAKLKAFTHEGKFFLQPKLNGERCRVEWFHSEPILFSSTGLEIQFLDHIKTALRPYQGVDWDGELYTHGQSRDWIASIASRKKNRHPEGYKLHFWIFDYVNFDEVQALRISKLGREHFDSPLFLTPTHIVSEEHIIPWTNYYLANGYEGVILRHPYGFYETKRSNAMLKYKPTERDEYPILEVIEAISEDGEKKGMVGAFRVLSPGKDIFKVSAGKIPHAKRKELWLSREGLKGKTLIVKHEKIKTGARGIPISCIAVEVKQ